MPEKLRTVLTKTSISGWVVIQGCILLFGLAACAQAPKIETKKESTPLIFPLPPDDPRFVYERTIRTSRDVDTSIVEDSLKDILTGGSAVTKNIHLRKPYAVVVHKGRLFVSEPSTRIIKVFDAPGNKYFTIGAEDPGKLAMPIGLDVDAVGNLYVADASANLVMVYDRDGNFLRKVGATKMGEPPLFKRLASVAVDAKGERIYAIDVGGTQRSLNAPEFHRVRVFDAKTGVHLFDIGKRGQEPGEFNLPRDAVLDKDNNLYVVDGGNFRVQVFTGEGKFVREFGKLGQKFGEFSRPKEISIDPAGNVYVIDTGFENFQIFTPEGKLLMFIGSGNDKDSVANYKLLSGIDVYEDGRVYVVDQQFKKIEIFRPVTLGANEGYLGKGVKLNASPAIITPANDSNASTENADSSKSDDPLEE